MSGLAEVLAEHLPRYESDGDFGEMQWVECSCDSEYFVDTEAGEAEHRAHVEAAVLAWLGERLAGAQEDVARAIVAADDAAYVDGLDAATADTAAEVAVAAMSRALGIDADHDPREEADKGARAGGRGVEG